MTFADVALFSATHMESIQIMLAVTLVAVRANDCPLTRHELHDGAPFLTQLERSSAQSDLLNCSWYRRDTCCSAEDTLRISHADPEIRMSATSRACRDELHLLMCAPCSPVQDAIFLRDVVAGFPVAVLQTCRSFCDRLFSACGSANLVLAGDREPDRVDTLFEDGRSFCRAVGLQAIERDEQAGAECFSAAPQRHGRGSFAAGALLAAGASLLFARTDSRSTFRMAHY